MDRSNRLDSIGIHCNGCRCLDSWGTLVLVDLDIMGYMLGKSNHLDNIGIHCNGCRYPDSWDSLEYLDSGIVGPKCK